MTWSAPEPVTSTLEVTGPITMHVAEARADAMSRAARILCRMKPVDRK